MAKLLFQTTTMDLMQILMEEKGSDSDPLQELKRTTTTITTTTTTTTTMVVLVVVHPILLHSTKTITATKVKDLK